MATSEDINLAVDILVTASGGPATCLVRICTGVACPGCGMSRAFVALLSGDVSGSIAAHPLGVVLAVEALAVIVLVMARHRPMVGGLWTPRTLDAALLAHVPLLVAMWLVRLATGTLPA
jgi:uncharacterized protein (DUF983 family)